MAILNLRWKANDYHFQLNNALIFLGSNHKVKQELYLMIKRMANGGTLGFDEEQLLGEDGVVMTLDDKRISSKNCKVISIETLEDIYRVIHFDKKGLLEPLIREICSSHESTLFFEELTDKLIALEISVNNQINHHLSNLQIEFQTLTPDNLLKKHGHLKWQTNEVDTPDYLVDPEVIVGTFCESVKSYIECTEQMLIIQLKFPDVFLEKNICERFVLELLKISRETCNLKLIIYHYSYSVNYEMSEISSCIICYEDYQQLPNFEVLRDSIIRNYPCEYGLNDQELLNSLLKVFPLVGQKVEFQYLLTSRDMLLLKLVNELLDLSNELETSDDYLNSMELAYFYS